MTKPAVDSSFTTDVARFYESNLVPLIFRPYAKDLAARVRAVQPSHVLEIACGTGVVTRALSKALGENSSIIATDLNQAMVEHAKEISTTYPVEWRQADVMRLPFPDDSFDVVACQFSVMFFPDRIAAYKEIRRVLKPTGSFHFSVWNELDRNDFARAVTKALELRYPENPPLFLDRTPHGHGNTREIEADLNAAGFDVTSFTQLDEVSRAVSPEGPAIAYCQGTPLRNEILDREPDGLLAATQDAAKALELEFGQGPIEGKISGVVVVAR